MGKFYYYRTIKNGKWYFHLKDNNNEIILSSSQGYKTREMCIKGIASVKKNSRNEKNYRLFIAKDRKYYFSLYARNGKCIGKSEGYETKYNGNRGVGNCISETRLAAIIRSPIR
jgi:uncharacterized protein YegP (UPF0339 family)